MKRRVRQKQSSFANATKTALGVGVISLVGVVAVGQVSALTYQNNVNVSFTIEDTITISLSSPNLVINELAPGAANDSNIITVNVQSNNPRGYTLNSTVGSSTYNNRNLTHATSNSATPFSSINYGTTVSTLSGFSPNQWGYSFSLDGGTTWINANKTGNVNDTGYSGLPLYTDEEHITTLKESNTTTPAGGDNVKFKIAAKAASAQASGEYKNVINFTAIGVPAPNYIQDLTLAQCQAKASDAPLTVIDRRDGSDYTVRYIQGNCWMTQNLRITHSTGQSEGTILGTDSNFSATSITFDGDQSVYGGSYDKANYHVPTAADLSASGLTANEVGVWYNFCATAAKDVANHACDSTAAYSGHEDICPANWHIPSTSQHSSITSSSALYPATKGGYYFTNTLYSATSYGRWWSRDVYYNQYGELGRHYVLYSYATNGLGISENYRYSGLYIRCIRDS